MQNTVSTVVKGYDGSKRNERLKSQSTGQTSKEINTEKNPSC